LRIIFLQTHAVSVKEKGGNLIENRTPFLVVEEIHTKTSSLENFQNYAQKPT
jgi:hypothetical protein